MCRQKLCRHPCLCGSITVFASLSLLLVSSFLLTLLEAARVKGLDAYAAMQRENAMESVFSGYDRDLFEQYGIFLLDGSYGGQGLQISQINGRLQAAGQKNLRPVFPAQAWRTVQNFYQMDVADASVTGYLLATDYDGDPFRKMAAESMKTQYPLELAQTLYKGMQSADSAMAKAQQSRSAMDQAQENIEAAKEAQAAAAKEAQAAEAKEAQAAAAQAATGGQTGGGQQDAPAEAAGASVENPMDVVKAVKDTDILTLVLPPGSSASEKAIREAETLEHRFLLQGNEAWQKSSGWYETVLYHQFLQTNFACYGTGGAGGGALDYELEYVQAGKKTDRENLKSVVRQLLLLREGINYMYLQTDAVKQEEAYGVATAVAASFGIAPAAGLIAQGILAAWAYVESILDVRTLLAGGKLAWMKTSESWTSSLSGLGGLLTGSARAKEQADGEDYKGYLQKLLWLRSERTLNYRAMDLLEFRAGVDGGESMRMDTMILTLRADISYEAEPLFSELVTIQKLGVDRWEFTDGEFYSYFSEN